MILMSKYADLTSDRQGRPLVAILLTSAIGLIAYTAVLSPVAQNNVFNWLLALSGLSSVFTWLTICLCHIRFRAAWKLAGHTLDELPFQSQPGVLGSWAGLIFNGLVFVAQFWTGFSPEGYQDMSTSELVVNFFEAYIAAPIIVVSFVGYKVWFKTRFVRLRDVDLRTGIRDSGEDLKRLKEIDRVEFKAMPWWRKVYRIFC